MLYAIAMGQIITYNLLIELISFTSVGRICSSVFSGNTQRQEAGTRYIEPEESVQHL